MYVKHKEKTHHAARTADNRLKNQLHRTTFVNFTDIVQNYTGKSIRAKVYEKMWVHGRGRRGGKWAVRTGARARARERAREKDRVPEGMTEGGREGGG